MQPLLSVQGLTKRYPGFTLDSVSFEVPPGYVMGLVGPNGAGKTTTLSAILETIRFDAGEIMAPERSEMGFVHDEPRFHRHLPLETTARLVAHFYPSWSQQTFERLARDFGLDLRKRFGALSRGTRMKFALALALSHRARLIVLDEPTASLDPLFRRELLDMLHEQIQDGGASVLFSTHITADLDRIADYVTLLQQGRVVFSEVKDDLLDTWGLVKGGNELLGEGASQLFEGVQRGPHGFEAITRDRLRVRQVHGEQVMIEWPTLEDIVLLTTGPRDA